MKEKVDKIQRNKLSPPQQQQNKRTRRADPPHPTPRGWEGRLMYSSKGLRGSFPWTAPLPPQKPNFDFHITPFTAKAHKPSGAYGSNK